MAERLKKAILFGVLLALVPLVLEALLILAKNRELSGWELTKDGELFLVAAGLSGAALGEFVFSDRPTSAHARAARDLAGFACVVVLVVGGGLYALLKVETPGDIDRELTVVSSVIAWFIAAVAVIVATIVAPTLAPRDRKEPG